MKSFTLLILIAALCLAKEREDFNGISEYEIDGCQDPYVRINGVYHAKPRLSTIPAFLVYCDQKIEGGGWVVIHRRFDGSVDFTRNWNDYRNGFGDISGEFWLGLEKVHQLTRSANYELLVVVRDNAGKQRTARYGQFIVHSEFEKYRLHVESFMNGTAEDCMGRHNRMAFATTDRDDKYGCASKYSSGWWFDNCYTANLNGLYKPGSGNAMSWHRQPDKRVGLLEARMMIRIVRNSVLRSDPAAIDGLNSTTVTYEEV
ncbi:fibrinogen gamma chain [Culex quinquefasciatus]|uniref:Fibrinogen gamma chain n=1 Tax=Culex quinquefasciatus TaxID=7176 RepID=B0WHF2_CULQU|nr:ficolin-1-A-like [Culex pipiens pallens]EDS27702.1 fibrinogen gamma chain [Culex quinquefasciatus]|eukprot:XP_001848136.1 fibrinogen gamma chain [Culex quinquefasciatus]